MRDIAKMSGTFWILIIICMLTEALFVPFLDNGNEFFQARFSFSAQEAGQYLMIPYLISAVATPIVGIIADKLGKRGWMIIITSFVFLGTHILLLLLSCTDVCLKSAFPLVFLGTTTIDCKVSALPSMPHALSLQCHSSLNPNSSAQRSGSLASFRTRRWPCFRWLQVLIENRSRHHLQPVQHE
jgi:MFS family permease